MGLHPGCQLVAHLTLWARTVRDPPPWPNSCRRGAAQSDGEANPLSLEHGFRWAANRALNPAAAPRLRAEAVPLTAVLVHTPLARLVDDAVRDLRANPAGTALLRPPRSTDCTKRPKRMNTGPKLKQFAGFLKH